MAEYTAGSTPVHETDVAIVASQLNSVLRGAQGTGMDGLDVALGAISATRTFVLWNVGPEGITQELENLALVMAGKERIELTVVSTDSKTVDELILAEMEAHPGASTGALARIVCRSLDPHSPIRLMLESLLGSINALNSEVQGHL